MKFVFFFPLCWILFSSCSRVHADINEEVVFDKHPFFGTGGVDLVPLQSGACFKKATTNAYKFVMMPSQFEENIPNLYSNDNSFVDINVFLRLKPVRGKTPVLLRDFGLDWYKQSLQEFVRRCIRDELSGYSMEQLVSERSIYDSAMAVVKERTETYVKEINLPVEIISFVVSKVEPPEEIRSEMNALSLERARERAEIQRLRTEEARMVANRAQAKAEAALYQGLGFTPAQYINYLRAQALLNRSDIIRIETIE